MEMRVGVSLFPPFVTKAKDGLSGFEIELWDKIATEIRVSSSFQLFKFPDLLIALKEEKIDIGMAGLSMTEEREKLFDFSHATFDSGLHILVANQFRSSWSSGLRAIFTKEVRNAVMLLLGFVIAAANLIWFAEQSSNGTLSGSYWPGIFNAFWWTLATVSTIGYGDYTPITWNGRILGILIILFGLAIFGLYVGQISAALTVKRLRSNITGPDDLKGKKVATVSGSTAEAALKALGASISSVSTIEEAYVELDKGWVDAVVFDAPILLQYANHAGRGRVVIVGELFSKQNYGFALKLPGGEWREKINQAILKLRDNGQYAELYKKYFEKTF